jgi:predicted Zn finger-like uncharacterized protein
MKFVCDRCQTKYSIADDRVRGKILKVKCKTCANVITVREDRRPSGSQPTLARPATAPHATVSPESEVDRTVLAPNPALFSDAIPAPAPRRPSAAMAAVGGPDEGLAWYMALSGERTGPYTRRQLVDKLVALPRNADLHVWNEQLGSWKPPAEVPAIAADLTNRRRAPPPLPPGAPRRAPTSPALASVGLGSGAATVAVPPLATTVAVAPLASAPPSLAPAHRPGPAAAHAPSGPALGGAAGAKLPPPTGATRPRATLSSLAAAAAPAHAREPAVDIDPSSMLETPAPQPHMLHAHGTNGTGATQTSSDVAKLLNLPGATSSAEPATPPRVMKAADVLAWGQTGDAPRARSRNTKLVIGLLGVVGAIVVLFIVALSGKKAPPPALAPKPASDPMAGMLEKLGQPEPAKPTVAPSVEPPPPVAPSTGRGGKAKPMGGAKVKGRPGATVAGGGTTAGGTTSAPADPTAARYADTSGGIKVAPLAAANRPPPSQAQLTSVVNNNRGAIKTCYQRALARDNSLTHGKIIVKLTLGISGRVKSSRVDGSSQFRTIEPCIKEVVSRWVFPQASEEYDFEFPLVFQGNE